MITAFRVVAALCVLYAGVLLYSAKRHGFSNAKFIAAIGLSLLCSGLAILYGSLTLSPL